MTTGPYCSRHPQGHGYCSWPGCKCVCHKSAPSKLDGFERRARAYRQGYRDGDRSTPIALLSDDVLQLLAMARPSGRVADLIRYASEDAAEVQALHRDSPAEVPVSAIALANVVEQLVAELTR